MSDLKAVIDVRELRANCPLDPCFIKLILKQSQFDQPVESGKLESRKELVLRGGRVDINEQFELPMEAQYMRQNKVTGEAMQLTVIIMASKGKEVSLLGVGNIDFRRINTSQHQTVLAVPLEKCSDSKAELSVEIRVSALRNSSQETFDIDQPVAPATDLQMTHRSMASTATVPLSVKSEGNSRRPKEDSKQRAIEISRRNFVLTQLTQKHSEILRQENKRSASKDSSGSYKKRFEYQQKIESHVPSSRNSQLRVFGKKPREKEPVARLKTPQPIRFEELKAKPIPPSKSKLKEGAFSNKHDSRSPKPEKREVVSQRYEPVSPLKQNIEPVEESPQRVRFAPVQAGHIVSNHTNSRSRSKTEQVDYSHLTGTLAGTLQKIEQRIQKEKMSVDTHHNNSSVSNMQGGLSPTSVCTFGETEQWRSNSRNQQLESCEVVTSVEAQPQRRQRLEEVLAAERRRIQQLEEEQIENEKLIEKLTKLYESCQDKLLVEKEQAERLHRRIESDGEQINRFQQELALLAKEKQEFVVQLGNRKSSNSDVELTNERRKVANLTSEIRFKENELKFAKLNQESLRAQKRQLEQEIRKLQSKQPISRKESRAELESQFMNSYPSTLRAENKLLREQVELLQKHNSELNKILEEKNRLSPEVTNQCAQHEQQLKDRAAENAALRQTNRLLQEKYSVLSEKAEQLQQELVITKRNLGEAMNVALESGGSELVELLESKMTFREVS